MGGNNVPAGLHHVSTNRGGTKLEEAAELYTKSANSFKLAKKYSGEYLWVN